MVIEIDERSEEHTFGYSSEAVVPIEKKQSLILFSETFKNYFASLNMTV